MAFGADTARILLAEGPGSALVVCVDARAVDGQCEPLRPRILVTLLLVDQQGALQEALQGIRQRTAQTGCSLDALFEALPKLWSQEQMDCVQQCVALL